MSVYKILIGDYIKLRHWIACDTSSGQQRLFKMFKMTLVSMCVNISESVVAAQGASWDVDTDRFSPGLWTQYCRAFNHIRYRTEQCPNPGTAEVNYLPHFPALHLPVCSLSALLFSLTHCLTNTPGPLTYLYPRLKIHVITLMSQTWEYFTQERLSKTIFTSVDLGTGFYPPNSLTYPASNPFIPPLPICCYYLTQLLTDDLLLSGNWRRLSREMETWNKKYRPCLTRSTDSRSNRSKARNKAISLHKLKHVTQFQETGYLAYLLSFELVNKKSGGL